MSFEDEFYELLNGEVTREPLTGEDGFGQPTYGSALTYPARVVHKPKLIRTAAGRSEVDQSVREVISNAQVWTNHVGWEDDDRITLPDGSQPLIIEVRSFPDEEGPHHQVVYV